jgi:biopolymer transport protein TolR
MAMDVGGAKGGIKSDINVTPLVDVMLVLLIIMMIVAPMLQKGVQVTLPEAQNSSPKPDTADATVVSIDTAGKLYIDQKEWAETDLVAHLKTTLEERAQHTVYLKADKDAKYGAVMKMMDALRKAQIDTVALITENQGAKKAGGE